MREWLQNLPDMFHVLVSDFGIKDILDIGIVAWIFYTLMSRLSGTNAARVAKGIVLLLVVSWTIEVSQLETLSYLLNRIIEMGVVALVIVFQPELRRGLERFGSGNIKGLFSRPGPTQELERGQRLEQVLEIRAAVRPDGAPGSAGRAVPSVRRRTPRLSPWRQVAVPSRNGVPIPPPRHFPRRL